MEPCDRGERREERGLSSWHDNKPTMAPVIIFDGLNRVFHFRVDPTHPPHCLDNSIHFSSNILLNLIPSHSHYETSNNLHVITSRDETGLWCAAAGVTVHYEGAGVVASSISLQSTVYTVVVICPPQCWQHHRQHQEDISRRTGCSIISDLVPLWWWWGWSAWTFELIILWRSVPVNIQFLTWKSSNRSVNVRILRGS